MTKLVLTSWEPSVKVVSLIELVRSAKQVGLLSAKREVEAFLDGETLIVDVGPSCDAQILSAKFEALGVCVEIQQDQ